MTAPTKRQLFNAGTPGATLSAANTAGDLDAIATPVLTGGGGAVFDAASAIHGTQGALITGVSGSVSAVPLATTANATLCGQCYEKVNAASRPSAGQRCVARIRSASANAMKIIQSSAGVYAVQNAAGSTLYSFSVGAAGVGAALPDGEYYFDFYAVKGVDTTHGTIYCRIKKKSDNSTVDTYGPVATVNAGTADLTTIQFASPEAITGNLSVSIDSIASLAGATGPIDPLVAAPTATLFTDYVDVEVVASATPVTFNQISGPATVPALVLGSTTTWRIARHATTVRVFDVQDAVGQHTASFNIPPVAAAGRTTRYADISGGIPGTTYH
jgi:hypothetical protein